VLQRVAACCSVMWGGADDVCRAVTHVMGPMARRTMCAVACCSVLRRVIVHCSVLQRVAACCSVLQCSGA